MEYRTRTRPVSFIPCYYSSFSISTHAALLIYPRVPDTVAELILCAQQTPMTIFLVSSGVWKGEHFLNIVDIVI